MYRLCLVFILFIFFGLIPQAAADCSTNTPGVYTFGSECQYMCHCANGASCNTNTGECTQGCDTNWFGPACQYRDLAEEMYSRQNSNQNPAKYSGEAIDGDTSTCSRTEEASRSNQSPWWRVWFPRNETIRDIYILTEYSSRRYFRSFEVKVEYVPENRKTEQDYTPTYSSRCYKNSYSKPTNENIRVQCDPPLVGNQVKIKLAYRNYQLVLCDVRIGGGRNFAFRKSVTASHFSSSFPPLNAVDGRMAPSSSSSWTGCFAASNTGNKYLDIDLGNFIYAYSVNVNTQSDDNIRDYQMYTASTTETGWQLLYDDTGNRPQVTYVHLNTEVQQLRIQSDPNYMLICELEIYGECPVNKCGYNCTENCYCESFEDYEHRLSGVCSTGCQERWFGSDDKCNIECDESKWGTQCQSDCGACRVGACNFMSGICTGGCQDGYQYTDYCTSECWNGTYGENCWFTCNTQCMNPNCNKTNGVCIGGCKAGYTGDKCDQVCPGGTYGMNCNESCSDNCVDVCDRVYGTCTTCKAGWKGNYCNTECDDGKHGLGCWQNCDPRCGETCDKVYGYCLKCPAGRNGNFCETECTNGRYGINCGQTCSDHCVDLCNKYDGSCSCSTGWQGDTCDDVCEDGTHGDGCAEVCGSCKDGVACDKINGSCLVGCAVGYRGSLCVAKIGPGPGDDSATRVGAIAGACSAIVVIAIIVVVVMLILRRRRRSVLKNTVGDDKENGVQNVPSDVTDSKKQKTSSKHDNSIYENTLGVLPTVEKSNDKRAQTTSVETITTETTDASYYAFDGDIERPKTARAIRVNELANYVKSRLAQQKFFENEFNDIPYGLQYPTLDAKKPGNMGKNRYKALYAYDHTRVVLKTLPSEPHSDYINASYIKGYHKDKAYIAAQGPTVNNVADFWRMIWENDLKMIAMVTNLVEETKTKCLKYWEAVGKAKTFGKVTVHTVSEEDFAEFSVRRFQISYEGEEKKKNIVQYAYTAWPDKDVPNSTCSLLHFWQKARKQDKEKSKPWLVHCSAGVGRTGTFIALDYLYDQGIDTAYVDINMCVRNLRDQRVNLVQMKNQYSYVYRIMVEALVLRSTPISMNGFDSYHADLMIVDPVTSKTQLQMDFESMEDDEVFVTNLAGQETHDASDMYTNAKIVDNKVKNRYSNILAADEFRPFLCTPVPGTNNYINAVYMPSYNDLHGYVMTQTPLPDTAVDCCRLIIEQEIHVIVTFDDAGENTVGMYLPTEGSIDVGPFKITFESEKEKDGYTIRRHTIRFKSKEQEIVQLDYRDWPLQQQVPEKSLEMLKLLHEVDGLQRQFENKPVLAQCLNGAERSGLFVVLMNVIERARIDEEVSIPQVIRYLRTRRHIIPNYEQYKFCHDVFLCYAESNATYANM